MSCPSTTLAVGANMTCTATHTFTQGELDAFGSPTPGSGALYNLVTADSTETEPVTDDLSIPITQVPSIDIEKELSVNGGPWLDADLAPGPTVPSDATVRFRFVVANTGNVTLTNVQVTDSVFDTSNCMIPTTLVPGQSGECVIGAFAAQTGQHRDLGTVTGTTPPPLPAQMDQDPAHYFGVLPSLVTDSALCTFDVDGDDQNGRQFKLIYTQEAPAYRLRAKQPWSVLLQRGALR